MYIFLFNKIYQCFNFLQTAQCYSFVVSPQGLTYSEGKKYCAKYQGGKMVSELFGQNGANLHWLVEKINYSFIDTI